MNPKKLIASTIIATTSVLGIASAAHADTLRQREDRWYSYQAAQLDRFYSEVAPVLLANQVHDGHALEPGNFNPAANAPCWLQLDDTVACGSELDPAKGRRAWVNADGTVSGL